MYHNEGLCFCVELALFDGFWPASHDVAHVIIRDVCCAQGKLGHNISVVCDPFSCSQQGSGGEGSVYCYTNSTQQIIMEECMQNKNTFIASLLQVSEVVSQRSKCIFLNEQTTNFFSCKSWERVALLYYIKWPLSSRGVRPIEHGSVAPFCLHCISVSIEWNKAPNHFRLGRLDFCSVTLNKSGFKNN